MQFGIYQICFFQRWSYNSFIFQTNCFFFYYYYFLFFAVFVLLLLLFIFIRSPSSRSNRSQMFFKIVHQTCNFMKRHQHKCFPVKFTKFLKTGILKNSPGGCFWSFATHDFINDYRGTFQTRRICKDYVNCLHLQAWFAESLKMNNSYLFFTFPVFSALEMFIWKYSYIVMD